MKPTLHVPRASAPLALALGVGTGCVTLGSYTTADSLGKGNYEVSVEPTAWVEVRPDEPPLVLPSAAVAVAAGVSDRIDVGGRLGGNGLDLGAKLMLTAPDSDGTKVSFAPFLGFYETTSGNTFWDEFDIINLPLLVGIPTSDSDQLVLGPRVVVTDDGVAGPRDAPILSLGTSVGYSARVVDHLRIHPEVTALLPMIRSRDRILVQGGIGLSFRARD